MSDDYVCTLDAKTAQKAKDELHEDPKERMSQVETFRKWIQEQPHLRCPTDTLFLLRFLRHGKFSQLRSREVLENFLLHKTEHPKWRESIDMADPEILDIIKTGYGSWKPDPKVTNRDKMIALGYGMALLPANDEETMVNGLTFLVDFEGFTIRHQTFYGLDTMKKTTKMWTNGWPGRFKSFNYYHIGPVFETIMGAVKPLMPKKLQERLHVHPTMESVYKEIPMECLPREYLPDDYHGPCAGTMDELIQNMVKMATDPEPRNRVLYETDPKFGNDKAQKPDDIPNESFRRLNVE